MIYVVLIILFQTGCDLMEEAYLDWLKTSLVDKLKFSSSQFKYVLTFSKMEQQNLDQRYNTVRPVKRRPVYTGEEKSRYTTIYLFCGIYTLQFILSV